MWFAHARREPLGNEIDYGFFEASFGGWLTSAMNLLNAHKVHLPGDSGFYFVQMGNEDSPSWTPFALAPTDAKA